MHTELFEKTAKLEEVQTAIPSLILKHVYHSQKLWCPHTTTGLFPLLQSKLKLKQIEKHDSKDSQTDYIQDRRTQGNSRKIRLENQTIYRQVLFPTP